MARKTKRRQPAKARRPAAAAGPSAAVQRPSASPASSGRIGGDQALVRSVEMSLAPGTPTRRHGGGRIVLEGTDPAIPLDRVPYFLTDLKQLGLVAGAMVVLLIVGAEFIVPHIIG